MIMEEDIVTLIGTLGFPIAMCIYLLIERSKTTKGLIKAINDLSLIIKTKMK